MAILIPVVNTSTGDTHASGYVYTPKIIHYPLIFLSTGSLGPQYSTLTLQVLAVCTCRLEGFGVRVVLATTDHNNAATLPHAFPSCISI